MKTPQRLQGLPATVDKVMSHRRFRLAVAFLGVLLLCGGAAASSPASFAVDGVMVGANQEQVVALYGQAESTGRLSPGTLWARYSSGVPGETTVTFTLDGKCRRVRGARLSIDSSTEIVLGDSKDRALSALGSPSKISSHGARELLEYRPSQTVVLNVVLDHGVVDALSLSAPDYSAK